jgi:hypothetical protein
MINNSHPATENIGVKMYSFLMGTFNFMVLIHHIYAMSSRSSSSKRFVPLHTLYFNDPWTLPSSTASGEGKSHIGMAMPLSVAKIAYQVILDSFVNPNPVTSQTNEEDHVLYPTWATSLSFSYDFLDETLDSDEAIVEAINGYDRPWYDMHHCSYFLPKLCKIEQDDFRSTFSEIVGHIVVPLDMHDIYVEGNMESISPTVMINISRIPGKMKMYTSVQIVNQKKF